MTSSTFSAPRRHILPQAYTRKKDAAAISKQAAAKTVGRWFIAPPDQLVEPCRTVACSCSCSIFAPSIRRCIRSRMRRIFAQLVHARTKLVHRDPYGGLVVGLQST
jgi:hypothetical protein